MMTDSRMSLLGVNLSGAEFGGTTGKYGYNYTYPTFKEIDYYASKDLNVIRLPFRWERLQTSLGGELDKAELARIDAVVDYAATKGISVVLDVHDFGAYDGKLVGSADVPNSAFADLWGKLADHFKSSSNAIFGLMNEPNKQTAASWIDSANAAIAAIRAAGAKQEILVPGTHWDGGSTWTTSDNASVVGTGVKDPLNNYAFEVHQYLDQWSSGTQSSVVSTTIGVERLTNITKWAEATGAKLFLGEFAVAQDAKSLTAMTNMLTYMSQHADAWQGATYWGAGPWWGDYMYSIEPTKTGADKPQMDVLENFTPGSGGTSGPIPPATTTPAPSPSTAQTTSTVFNADGSRDVTILNIQKKAYASERDHYSKAGVLTAATRTHADGTLAYSFVLGSDGTKTTGQHDAKGIMTSLAIVKADGSSDTKGYTNGALTSETLVYGPGSADLSDSKLFTADILTRDTIVHADKSRDVATLGIVGRSYTAQTDAYRADGTLVNTTRMRADQSLVSVYALGADGTKTTTTYDSANAPTSTSVVVTDGSSFSRTLMGGVVTSETTVYARGSADLSDSKLFSNSLLQRETIVHADKSRDVFFEHLTSKAYAAEHNVYDPAGVLTELTRTRADGTLVSHYVRSTDGIKTTDLFDAANALTSSTVVRADGSSTTQTFAGHQLIQEAIAYAPGTAVRSQTSTFAGSVLSSATIVQADKSSDRFLYDATGATIGHDVLNAQNKLALRDATNADGSHSVAIYEAGRSFASTAHVADTITAATAGGTTIALAPAMGHDTVVGFHAGTGPGRDVLKIDPGLASDFAHLQMAMSSGTGGTTIAFNANDSVALRNVAMTTLSAQNFSFG